MSDRPYPHSEPSHPTPPIIVLTGGGTAGHVTPNLALIPSLHSLGWQIEYIGSQDGIERQLVTELGISYHGIASGKFRRYFDLKNFSDPFRVLQGIWAAFWLLRKIKPRVIFSKGGFVTVPVILASWLQRIPVVIHESDLTPGLANKISIPCATKICVTFPETQQYIPQAICTGLPIRQEIFRGNAEVGRLFCKFQQTLPVLLVIGGSTGSAAINAAIRSVLPQLTVKFQMIHACGKGNLDQELADYPHYRQVEYLSAELADVLALADLVVSRAGANAVFELLALQKPNLLIPLPKAVSRGDQILNARSFQSQGYSAVMAEESLTKENLVQAIFDLYEHRHKYIQKMANSPSSKAIDQIIELITQI